MADNEVALPEIIVAQAAEPEMAQPIAPAIDPMAELESMAEGRLDDDYQKTLADRDDAKGMDWFNEQAAGLGIIVDDTASEEAPAEAEAEAAEKGWGQTVLDGAKAVGSDLAGIPGNMGKIAVGGPMKAAQSVIDLTGSISDWFEDNVASFGGLQIYDKDGKFNPDLLGPDAWKQFKKATGYKGSDAINLPNVGGVMDAPTDSMSSGMLQAMVQFLTGFAAAGKAIPALTGATSWQGQVGQMVARSGVADFAAFDGHEQNLANLVESFPAISNPVTEFLATDQETPEMINRLKNVAANAPFNIPFGVVLTGLRSIRAARKIKAQAGAKTYEEAAQVLARSGLDVGDAVAQPTGGKLESILGNPNDDIVKFVDPYVKQTADAAPAKVGIKPILAEPTEDETAVKLFGRSFGELDPNNQAKVKTELNKGKLFSLRKGDAEAGRSMREDLDSLGYYSGALRAARDLKQEKGTPEQMLAMLKKGGGGRVPPEIPAGAASGDGGPGGPGPFSTKTTINWARINTPDDVKSVIGQMADAYAPEIAAKQRGIRTNAMTEAAAGDQNAWKLLIGERKGNLPTAEEQLALRQLWSSSGQKLMETAKIAANGGQEEMFAFRRMMAVHNTIQQEVIGIRTETARALQQWRIPAGGDAEKLKQLQFAITANGGENVTRALAERIAVLSGRPEWQGAIDQMVRRGAFAKSMDAVREIWINAILSGPKTHLVNMMSNSAVVGQSMIERAIAGQIGHIIDPVDGVRVGEATAMWWGVRQSMRDALVYAWEAMKTGESGYGRGQIESPRVRTLSAENIGTKNAVLGKAIDMIGGTVNIPGRMLGAEDEFFKTINYRAELWAQSFRQASEEMMGGAINQSMLKSRIADLVNDPPENLRLKAADFAAYNTFTSEPGQISQTLMRVKNALDHSAGFPVGTMIMPFINTPGNLMKYTFERTPLAPLMSKVRADIIAGGARRDLALARIGLGTIMVTTAYDMAMDGHVTSSGPDGDKGAGQRQALKRSGWQPYSVRVRTGGTDEKPEYRWFAYNRLDPIGGQFAMAAEFADLVRNSDGRQSPQIEEIASAMVLGASQTYLNKSYFSGAANLMAAMQNPDRYGESYFTKLASSFVPTGVAELARVGDPVMRQTWDMLSALKARTPGLSAELPPRLNFWGEPISYQSGLGATYDAVSPVYSSSNAKAKEVDREMFRLNFFPTHPGSLQIAGKAISLRNDPVIKNRMIELTSTIKASTLVNDNWEGLSEAKKKSSINRLMGFGDDTLIETMSKVADGSHPILGLDYLEADDDDKVKLLQDVIRTYRDAAKAQVLREYPELIERREALPSREDISQEPPF